MPRPGEKHILSALATAAMITVALAGCSAGGTPESNTTGTGPVSAELVYVGYEGSPLNLLERVAIDQGIFEDNGLNVSFVPAQSGQAMMASILGGSAQVASMTMTAAAPLVQQGECLQLLTAGPATWYPLLARADVPLQHEGEPYPTNLLDLKGKTIGVANLGATQERELAVLLEDAGLSLDDVTLIATGDYVSGMTAFREKQVEVLMAIPPTHQVLDPSEYNVIADLPNETEPRTAGMIQMFDGMSCDYAEAHPQVVQQYCTAAQQMYDFAKDPANTETMVEQVGEIFDIDADTASAVWDALQTAWKTPRITEESWEQQKFLLGDGTPLPSYDTSVSKECQNVLD